MIQELKWFSVHECLPKERVQVLALKRDGTYCVARISIGITIAQREKMKLGQIPCPHIEHPIGIDSVTGKPLYENVPRWKVEKFCDEHVGNFKPYSWWVEGNEEQGTSITYWAELAEPNDVDPFAHSTPKFSIDLTSYIRTF